MLEKILNEQGWLSERMAFFQEWYNAPVQSLVNLHRSVGLGAAVSKMPAEDRISLLPLLEFDASVLDGRLPFHVFDIDSYETGIFLILGTGRSGKTATAYDLIRRSQYPNYLFNVDIGVLKILEKQGEGLYFRATEDDIFRLRSCNIVLDDAALWALSRNSSDSFNKALSKWYTIISHKDIRLFVLIQNAALLDLNTFRSQNIFVIQKRSNALNVEFERSELQNAVRVANLVLKLYAESLNVDVRNLFYEHTTKRVYLTELPEWYNDRLSKPYRDYVVEVKK